MEHLRTKIIREIVSHTDNLTKIILFRTYSIFDFLRKHIITKNTKKLIDNYALLAANGHLNVVMTIS